MAVLASLTLTPGRSLAATSVGFETLPNGSPSTDDFSLPLDAVYFADGLAVTFGFDGGDGASPDGVTDTQAVIEAVGGQHAIDLFGFTTIGTPGDGEVDTELPPDVGRLGGFFLRAPTSSSGFADPGRFVIRYDTADIVTAVSGEIWDIDAGAAGAEQWRVRVFDDEGGLLGEQTSPLGIDRDLAGTLDGRRWVFSFGDLAGGIDHIWIDFVGTKTGSLGFAFDNFNPTTEAPPIIEPPPPPPPIPGVPEPGSAAIALVVAVVAGMRRRRVVVG